MSHNYFKVLAFFISRLFGPETVIAVVLWTMITFGADFQWFVHPYVLIGTLVFFICIPFSIFIYFYLFGHISDIDLTLRHQRPPVLIAKQISYTVGLVFVLSAASPVFQTLFIWWYVTALAVLIISLSWKVSLHMTMNTMVVVLLEQLWGGGVVYGLFVLPLIAWSRLYLKKHVIAQLVVGLILPIVIWALLFESTFSM